MAGPQASLPCAWRMVGLALGGCWFSAASLHLPWLSAAGVLSSRVSALISPMYFPQYASSTGCWTTQESTGQLKLGSIGFAIAQHLAQDGAHVIISNRKQHNVDHAVTALREEGLHMPEHCGGVDFLVCVAGVNPLTGSTLRSNEQIWDKILDVNGKAPALLLSQFLPNMESRQGSVVLVSSIAAYTPIPCLGVYNVSKTALLGLTKTRAVELAPKNICVNCLVPGIINTDFSHLTVEDQAFMESMKKIYGLQRVGQPEDCVGLVSFLCSPDASYITGESIAVAGWSPHL
ncbi:dehydrogenase/reductase SDR family member 2, mitochondrial-like [Nannospalax galili]|uniref:dehydrogenase/reductase SDR family member 2, mitochondrial-like n=1 Tax=Nannospalax galili TaxID=1026970 RepID=UPI00111C2B0B|nr:dehydrogenase/reductase SDR family member 2, mitochondrial-like [Nannospalax galili]